MTLREQPRSQQQAEIQRAIEDAQRAAQEAAQNARSAAERARDAAQGADASGEPAQPAREGTIIFPSDNGPDIELRVDGSGIHVQQAGQPEVVIPIKDVVPRGAVQITYAVCATLVIVSLVGPLLRYFLRRADRRAVTTQLSAEVQARLDAMDRNIDTVAVELERVSEGQRFTNKLLEQRPLEHAQRSDR
jgi:type II secretory pathway pseudopilin PulG